MMENSFDNAHFSSCTRPTSASSTSRSPRPTVRRDRLRLRGRDHGAHPQPARKPRITGTTEPITHRHLVNRYYLPFARRFGCTYPASGIDHVIYNCATPIDDGRMMLAQWLYRSDSEADCPTQALIDWDEAITRRTARSSRPPTPTPASTRGGGWNSTCAQTSPG
jgi:hypothetical protein